MFGERSHPETHIQTFFHHGCLAMNTTLQAQFDRVETALNTLIDSISAYNPSPAAAVALVAADDDLSHGLDQRIKSRQSSTIQAHY